ncbi:hypothetical protein AB0K08_06835 [Citricoccus sp. NPDC055426]|uniref:hypothetical protein n=1 Tax=Citricoccus sp. NPDC055426 TaxID=3155536 RepID=UPI00341C3D19
MITAGFTHGRSDFFGVAAPAGPGVPALPDDGRLAGVVVAADPEVEAGVDAVLEAEAAGVEAAGVAEGGAAAVDAAAPAEGAPPIRFFGAAASPVSEAVASGAAADGVLAWAAGAPPMRRFGAPAAGAAGASAAAGDAVGPPAAGWAVAES